MIFTIIFLIMIHKLEISDYKVRCASGLGTGQYRDSAMIVFQVRVEILQGGSGT